ncbi:hypothetical protein [Bacillus coahuilensis]|uniref:hypothetical protein n=1 Tax=Bacillus coahuilensis TaxID=408580 RepID=UPI0012ACE888|nr:hypothetical protein [Bacillus coahuilensis]
MDIFEQEFIIFVTMLFLVTLYEVYNYIKESDQSGVIKSDPMDTIYYVPLTFIPTLFGAPKEFIGMLLLVVFSTLVCQIFLRGKKVKVKGTTKENVLRAIHKWKEKRGYDLQMNYEDSGDNYTLLLNREQIHIKIKNYAARGEHKDVELYYKDRSDKGTYVEFIDDLRLILEKDIYTNWLRKKERRDLLFSIGSTLIAIVGIITFFDT